MAQATPRSTGLTTDEKSTTWKGLQAAGVVAYIGLVSGLALVPAPTLRVFWDLAIPLVPLMLFINPLLWRNVCPLATLNTLANGTVDQWRVRGRTLRGAWYVGIVLLSLIIPARLVWFNESGPALAALLVVLGTAALALGAVYDRRAGFCNSLCPLLPVERLYGQYPLYVSERVRCPSCSACVSRGCIDLSPALAGLRATDAAREGHRPRWVLTAPGLFAIAFPGIVGGYFLADLLGGRPPAVAFGLVLGGGLISVVLLGSWIALRRTPPATALPALALTAGLLYYWCASSTLAAWIPAVSLEFGVAITRTLFIAILAGWYARGWGVAHEPYITDTARRSPTSPPGESFLPQGG